MYFLRALSLSDLYLLKIRQMGRRKNSVVRCLEQIQKINYEPPPLQDACPTLDKGNRCFKIINYLVVIKSNEMHLFDLSSLQLELERLLTSITERLACLSAESKGHELPPEIMNALQLLNSNNDIESGQPALAGPSLVVKANPDKPLTLIISQSSRTSQHQSALSSLDASVGYRTKTGHSIPCVRRSSRVSAYQFPSVTTIHFIFFVGIVNLLSILRGTLNSVIQHRNLFRVN